MRSWELKVKALNQSHFSHLLLVSKTHSVIFILRCTLLKHANFKHTDFNQSYTLVNCVDVFHWLIVHFTVACLVAKLLKRSKAKGDLMMIQTLLLFKYKLLS